MKFRKMSVPFAPQPGISGIWSKGKRPLSAQSHALSKWWIRLNRAINCGQENQNFSDITLKEKQYEVLQLLVVEEKDVALPTGYGKSLIY